jgi:hypothetical protein
MPNQTDGVAVAAVRAEAAVHPLLEKKVRTTANWCEWLALWQSTENFGDLRSLLHDGFTTSLERAGYNEKEYDKVDRLIFYFSIADGWDTCEPFQKSETTGIYFLGHDFSGNRILKNSSELRQMLAQKAFDMLCLNFFKAESKEEQGDEFANFGKFRGFDRLQPVIQNFFRPEKNMFSETKIRNLTFRGERSHNEEQAVNFLLKLVKSIWKWKAPVVYFSQKQEREKEEEAIRARKARVDSLKPWLIEVLAQLGRLDILQEHILELDKPCLDKLEEIALRTELKDHRHPVAEDRLVTSIEEACYAGSGAAWFLKRCQLKMKEQKRLMAIQNAERKFAESKRKLAELSGKAR